MALSPEDVAALGQLLDQRLESHAKLIDQKLADQERRARSRRRFWFWFWMLLFLVSSVASWWTAQKLIARFQDQVAAIENETLEAKISYQRQLARDRKMQAERKQVEHATGYQSSQNLGDFDAQLMRQAFQLLGKSSQFQAKQKKPGTVDSDTDIDQQLKDVGDMTEQMSQMIGQLLLHETDPAHDTKADRLAATGEAPAKPAPRDPALDEQLQQLQESQPTK
jgi:hypothetical protein